MYKCTNQRPGCMSRHEGKVLRHTRRCQFRKYCQCIRSHMCMCIYQQQVKLCLLCSSLHMLNHSCTALRGTHQCLCHNCHARYSCHLNILHGKTFAVSCPGVHMDSNQGCNRISLYLGHMSWPHSEEGTSIYLVYLHIGQRTCHGTLLGTHTHRKRLHQRMFLSLHKGMMRTRLG